MSRSALKYLFFSLIFVGVISESIFLCWLMLDLSTLVFMFLIFNLKLNYVNNLIHYYLIQVGASIGLFGVILVSMGGGMSLESLFLYLKLGVFPFHFWYFSLLMKLDWGMIFILMSPNKLIVLSMLFNLYSKMFFLLLVLNLLFVLVSALFEKHIKLILGLSSLFNMVWVLMSFNLGGFWLVYFLGYSLNLFLMVWLLTMFNKKSISDYSQLAGVESCFFLGINVFILLGLPPFLSFFFKIYILSELCQESTFYIILVVSSIFFVYLYLMFFFFSLTSMLQSNKLSLVFKSNNLALFLMSLNLALSISVLTFYYLNNSCLALSG